MKYMQNGSFKSNRLMKLTLVASLLFFAGFWVTTALMYFSKMDLAPSSVVEYYNGSDANFTQPRTYGSMLEVTHGHLPVMALVALLLTHLFIFTPFSTKLKTTGIIAFFASALLGEAASWLVRFVHAGFAWLKITAFVALEISMAFIIIALLQLLQNTPKPSKHQSQQKSILPLENISRN